MVKNKLKKEKLLLASVATTVILCLEAVDIDALFPDTVTIIINGKVESRIELGLDSGLENFG